MTKNKIQPMQIGQMVFIGTNHGCICGLLTMTTQYLDADNRIKNIYHINFNNNNVSIPEDSITDIRIFSPENDNSFLKIFEIKYGVKCFEIYEPEKVKMVEPSKILTQVIEDGVWDKLSQDEKKRLLEVIVIDREKTIVELIDGYLKSCDMNDKLHNKVTKIKDATFEFMTKYKEISSFIPGCKWAFDALFNILDMDKLINSMTEE